MKIALVAPTSIPARRANTLQVMKMAQALMILGHQVRVVSPRPQDGAEGAGAREENGRLGRSLEALARLYGLSRRVPVEWLPASARLRRYDYGWRAFNWARRWGAELVYTRLPQTAALASLAGMPAILEVHDLPQGVMGPVLFRAFLKGSGARRLVVITHRLALDLNRAFSAPLPREPEEGALTLLAPDGVDMDRYQDLPDVCRARRELTIFDQPGPDFIAGYTGHLYQGRGVRLILDIASRLTEMGFLLVGGEPQDVRRLSQAVRSRNLSNVYLTGFVPNAEVPLYQAACDVLLMPYQQRVAASSGGDIARYLSPMKLFEYLAAGRAILSSDLPVLREALSPEFAILLPPGEPEAWVKALKTMRADPALGNSLGRRARDEARRYTWESRAARILEGL
jgi:glycosyltransferase involved in cell wall biosynthesis